VAPERIAQIFNPLNLDEWFPDDRARARHAIGVPDDSHVVTWHGRIALQNKGLLDLLDAWDIVVRDPRARDPRLVLVGSGHDSRELHEILAARRLPGILWHDTFVADRRVLRQHLCAGNVYVFPSRHEGFPCGLIEAMACGLPVVAAAAQGVEDILRGGESDGGSVVPRQDPPALASHLLRLLDDPSKARAMGEHARRRANSAFSLAAVGGDLRSFVFPPGRAS
jgi:glycosyltransferase involved in cell wall biosynthesis